VLIDRCSENKNVSVGINTENWPFPVFFSYEQSLPSAALVISFSTRHFFLREMMLC